MKRLFFLSVIAIAACSFTVKTVPPDQFKIDMDNLVSKFFAHANNPSQSTIDDLRAAHDNLTQYDIQKEMETASQRWPSPYTYCVVGCAVYADNWYMYCGGAACETQATIIFSGCINHCPSP